MFSIYIGIILLLGSVFDWKYYSLPMWLVLAACLGGMGGALYRLFGERVDLISVCMSFLPGVLTLLLAYLTREQIGYGDGMLLLAMGGSMGLQQTIMILGIALAGSFVVSVVLLVTRRAGRGQRLPFVPFLFGGTVVAFGGGWFLG